MGDSNVYLVGWRDKHSFLAALVVLALLGLMPACNAVPQSITHNLKPFTRGEVKYRWMDIADNPYSASFRRKFRYREGQVTVTYAAVSGATLRGRLVARGLKPNFAYQIKLEGQPVTGAAPSGGAAGGAQWANARIGSVGRWWCVQCDANTWVDTLGSSYHEGHTLLGYLLFDFFVTDARGDAVCDFAADSSFHVLWKVSQNPRGESDGAARRLKVEGSRRSGYERAPKPSVVEIYAEHEYGRPDPGMLQLPAGRYACRLLLTEESFHAWGTGGSDDFGGHWAHCLSDEGLEFTVVLPPESPMGAPSAQPGELPRVAE